MSLYDSMVFGDIAQFSYVDLYEVYGSTHTRERRLFWLARIDGYTRFGGATPQFYDIRPDWFDNHFWFLVGL